MNAAAQRQSGQTNKHAMHMRMRHRMSNTCRARWATGWHPSPAPLLAYSTPLTCSASEPMLCSLVAVRALSVCVYCDLFETALFAQRVASHRSAARVASYVPPELITHIHYHTHTPNDRTTDFAHTHNIVRSAMAEIVKRFALQTEPVYFHLDEVFGIFVHCN